jgi:hypothetical protein
MAENIAIIGQQALTQMKARSLLARALAAQIDFAV